MSRLATALVLLVAGCTVHHVRVADVRQRVAVGVDHSCALDASDRVWCWGGTSGGAGYLRVDEGDSPAPVLEPHLVSEAGAAIEVAAGIGATCVRSEAGAVVCWTQGRTDAGELGVVFRRPPTELGPIREVLVSQRSVWVRSEAGWFDADGALVTPVLAAPPPLTFVAVPEAVSVTAPWFVDAAGQLFRNGAAIDGTVWAPVALAGRGGLIGGSAVLADGTTRLPRPDAPNAVLDLSFTPAAIAGDTIFGCALDADGAAWCWRGDGTSTPTPEPFAPEMRWREIATGVAHACGIDASGLVWCWGVNVAGELGDGTLVGSDVPVRVVFSE